MPDWTKLRETLIVMQRAVALAIHLLDRYEKTIRNR
jgi:hypothetical protein